MLVFLKQLFCNHLWRTRSSELLYTSGVQTKEYIILRKEVCAVTEQCVKCKKKKIVKRENRIPDLKLR